MSLGGKNFLGILFVDITDCVGSRVIDYTFPSRKIEMDKRFKQIDMIQLLRNISTMLTDNHSNGFVLLISKLISKLFQTKDINMVTLMTLIKI